MSHDDKDIKYEERNKMCVKSSSK